MATSVDKIRVGGNRVHDAIHIPDAMNATNQSNVFTSLGQELLNRRADKTMNTNSLAQSQTRYVHPFQQTSLGSKSFVQPVNKYTQMNFNQQLY